VERQVTQSGKGHGEPAGQRGLLFLQPQERAMRASSDVPPPRPDDMPEGAPPQAPIPRDVRPEEDRSAEDPAEGPREKD